VGPPDDASGHDGLLAEISALSSPKTPLLA
jgi:hypothetical protein